VSRQQDQEAVVPKQVSQEAINWRVGSTRYAAQMERWLNGQTWELTPGVDYDCSTAAFRAHCYYKAREYKVKIHTKFQNGKLYIKSDPGVTDYVATPEERA
jgi:hypothetical protein